MCSYSRKNVKYSNKFIMVGQMHHEKCVDREKDGAEIRFHIKFTKKILIHPFFI